MGSRRTECRREMGIFKCPPTPLWSSVKLEVAHCSGMAGELPALPRKASHLLRSTDLNRCHRLLTNSRVLGWEAASPCELVKCLMLLNYILIESWASSITARSIPCFQAASLVVSAGTYFLSVSQHDWWGQGVMAPPEVPAQKTASV